MQTKLPLIIPVENQVRELDPKLLLSYIAVARGFTVYIGSRREIHFHLPAFPRGIYLSKSMTGASDLMFRIMRAMGHQIVAWDEEALVHLPDEIYYSRRLSPQAMAYVGRFFAWGKDNAELWRRYSHIDPDAAIIVTGNPRNDLLRPELPAYYEEDVRQIGNTHGEFILINTNFNHVNGFTPVQNLFLPASEGDASMHFGRAAKGMTREYALGLYNLKRAVFADFQEMIPRLSQAFPDTNFVVRPHPTENPDVYKQIASTCQRVVVTNEGNVVPWLLAAKALIHNGCTTGVEAHVMRVPALSYRASTDDDYDFGFYRLPNSVSQPCFNLEELKINLARLLNGEFSMELEPKHQQMISHYLAAIEGPFACQRIVEVLEELSDESMSSKGTAWWQTIGGWALWFGRTRIKRFKDSRPHSHNRPEFQKHRYPEVSLEDIRDRIARFQKLLGDDREIKVEKWQGQFFRISAH